MTRFISADAIPEDEAKTRLAAGEIKPCAPGPAGGQWYVICEPGNDPDEIITGLPGGVMMSAGEYRHLDEIEGQADDTE